MSRKCYVVWAKYCHEESPGNEDMSLGRTEIDPESAVVRCVCSAFQSPVALCRVLEPRRLWLSSFSCFEALAVETTPNPHLQCVC